MRGTIGDIEAQPGGADLALRLLDEVIAIVRAVGQPPSEACVTSAQTQFTTKGSAFASSMFRDIQRGRPIEVESIVGDLLHRGTKAEIATPLLTAAYIHLMVYERKVVAA